MQTLEFMFLKLRKMLTKVRLTGTEWHSEIDPIENCFNIVFKKQQKWPYASIKAKCLM